MHYLICGQAEPCGVFSSVQKKKKKSHQNIKTTKELVSRVKWKVLDLPSQSPSALSNEKVYLTG